VFSMVLFLVIGSYMLPILSKLLNVASRWVALLFYIWGFEVQILAQEQCLLTEDFCNFPIDGGQII
jgi:hypothetical protein